jgi:mannose-6-phosphate isomerase-like protein (cupin superfamily)
MPEPRTVPLLQLIVDFILRVCFIWEVTMIASPLSGNVLGSIDDAFVVAEWRDAGCPAGPPRYIAPLHVHHADDEAWYVSEGTLRVLVGKDEVEAHAGSGVFVPRRTVHTYWNPAPAPVRYLLIMTANIYRLIQEIHATQSRTPDTLRAVFRKFDSELVESWVRIE